MIGACAFALLQQGQQFEQGGPAECCAQLAAIVRGQVGGLDGQAQAHEAAIGHDDMAGALGRMADGEDGEPAAVQRVGGVGHLDLFGSGRRWVLEGGIMLLSR